MRDLEIATEKLRKDDVSLVVVKDGLILLSKKGMGIRPLFDGFSELGMNAKGSFIADRVIGKAAAALCIHAGVHGVYTPVLSKPAAELLKGKGIFCSTDSLVPGILNKERTDFCPLEKITADIDNYRDMVNVVKIFLTS